MSRLGAEMLEASDVLQKLGRPSFPLGMMVLLIGDGSIEECREIEEQMKKLCYKVTRCNSLSEARQQLASPTSTKFDIILAEASLASKELREGVQLFESVSSLPLVLISSPEGMTECVWRGIEIGAAEVLEKPLSTHKLQNIWQHVVRKALDCKDGADTLQTQCLQNLTADMGNDHYSAQSKQTRSSNMSTVTTQDDKTGFEMDHSFSGSPEVSADASVSNTSPLDSHTVESTANDSQTKMDWAPSRAVKRPHDSLAQANVAAHPKRKAARGLRPAHSNPVISQTRPETVVGMVHPSWANSQGQHQAYRGDIPPGCVWGTPLNPPPGWQAPANVPGPLLGSAASDGNTLHRYNSAPVLKLEPLSSGIDTFDSLADLDPSFMGNLGDEFLLGSEFLDCDDSFLNSLNDDPMAMENPRASDLVLEAPPIGLALKKSESLVNLINSHLVQSRA